MIHLSDEGIKLHTCWAVSDGDSSGGQWLLCTEPTAEWVGRLEEATLFESEQEAIMGGLIHTESPFFPVKIYIRIN